MKHLTFAIVVFVLTGCGPNSSEKVLNELQAQRIKQEAAKAEAVK